MPASFENEITHHKQVFRNVIGVECHQHAQEIICHDLIHWPERKSKERLQ